MKTLREKRNGNYSGSHCPHSVHRRRNDSQGHLLGISALITAILIDVSQSRLVVVPQSAVTTNCAVTLHCKSGDGHRLKWYAQRYGSSEKELLWTGYDLTNSASSYCNVTNDSPGSYNLILNGTKTTGQRYICQEPGSLQEESADVVVVDPSPDCFVNSTDVFVNLTCTVKFRGHVSPIMVWSVMQKQDYCSGKTGPVANTTVIPNLQVTSSLVLPVNVSNAKYICTTALAFPGTGQSAPHLPEYYHQWIYEHRFPEIESTVASYAQQQITRLEEHSDSAAQIGGGCSASIGVAVALIVTLIVILVLLILAAVYIFVKKEWKWKQYVSITIYPNTSTEKMEGKEQKKENNVLESTVK